MKNVEETVEKIRRGEEDKNVLYGMIKDFLNFQEKKYIGFASSGGMERGDIISLVWLGVERAISTYHKERDCKFLTWAGVCIKYIIMEEGKKHKCREISLDTFPNGDEELSMEEIIADEEAMGSFEKAETGIDGKKAMEALGKLSKEEQEIVNLTCIKNIPLARAARGMGITTGHARTLRLSALKKLKGMIM